MKKTFELMEMLSDLEEIEFQIAQENQRMIDNDIDQSDLLLNLHRAHDNLYKKLIRLFHEVAGCDTGTAVRILGFAGNRKAINNLIYTTKLEESK